ncbi:MAG: glycerol-3-phosphate 1-O-acyltransferase PlsY [Peptoniphilaceae bacterium]|nr:glycerol-3-phosphate 1-O-acyltransferase PlsY [Peptoniphilaceae bacterium]
MMKIFIAFLSYLLGSLPAGFVIAKFVYKQDIRTLGSGNIGATNLLRNFGKAAGVMTFVFDCFKGILAVFIGKKLLGDSGATIALMFVVLGHIFSIFLKFRGGKGIATSFGALCVADFKMAMILITIFIILVALTRKVSLGSVVVATLAPFLSFYYHGISSFSFAVFFIAVLIDFRHRDNIKRLIRGEEKKLF